MLLQAADARVFQYIEGSVESAFQAFVEPAAANLMGALQAVALTGATLYLVLTGLLIATGTIEAPLYSFLKTAGKIALVVGFALTAEGYLGLLVGALRGLETGLVQAMQVVRAGPPPDSIFQQLDQALGQGFSLSGFCFERAGLAGLSIGAALSWACTGVVIGLGTALVALLGGAVILVAKFALAILFALGPLFVLSLMAPATAKFFDGWLSQCLNFTMQSVIVSIISSLAIAIFQQFILKVQLEEAQSAIEAVGGGTPAGQNPWLVALQIAVLSGVFVWIILQSGSLASGLAGGAGMAAISLRQMAMPVKAAAAVAGGAARGAAAAARGGYNLVNPVSTRRDASSGQAVEARRFSHILQGNTPLAAAYRQAARNARRVQKMARRDQRRSNWRGAGGHIRKD
jgi:type IV secretion system protein VirB6